MTRDLPNMLHTAVVMSLALTSLSHAQGPVTENAHYFIKQDVPYRDDAVQTEYMRSRCRLDVRKVTITGKWPIPLIRCS